MAEHIKLGQKGEDIAFDYLIKKGYKVIVRNWRYNNSELDIVAIDENVLVVVEVKTRSSVIYEEPGELVSAQKIRLLVNATEAFIQERDIDLETRFDVIAIKWYGENKFEINHCVGAFGPPVN
jgi:putative endonuclease